MSLVKIVVVGRGGAAAEPPQRCCAPSQTGSGGERTLYKDEKDEGRKKMFHF